MTMPIAIKSAKLLNRDARYIIDIFWDATLVLANAFIVVLMFIFIIGYAIDLGIITNIP